MIVLALGVVLALLPGTIPTADNSTPANEQSTDTTTNSNTNTVSNINAVNRPRIGPPNVNRTFPEYPGTYPDMYPMPTFAPVEPISHSANGFTVTLYPMHADSNLIVLTYTVQSSYEDLSKLSPYQQMQGAETPFVSEPVVVMVDSTPVATATPDAMARPSATSEPYEPRLTTSNGNVIPWLRDIGWQLDRNLASAPLIYDASQVSKNLPDELQLRLVLNKAEVFIPDTQGGAHIQIVKGPFTFDFSMPLDRVRRVAEVNQTVSTTGGDTITLRKVIVTRHSVRAVWKLDKAQKLLSSPTAQQYVTNLYACCTLKLELDGYPASFPSTYLKAASETGEREQVWIGSLLDKQGYWEISTWHYSTWTGSMYYPPKPGPVFRFSVPPATVPKNP
jgi:hypothetical protein